MQQQPLVSIILPLYNNEKHISSCIESILNQSLDSFEILCIDGDSNDKTIDIIKNFSKDTDCIKIFLSYKKTLGGLINHGLSIAKGRYVTIINPKDYIRQDMLEYLHDLTQKNYIDIVQGNISIENDEFNLRNSIPIEKAFKIVDVPDFLYNPYFCCGVIFKRSFLIHKNIKCLEKNDLNVLNNLLFESSLKSDTIKYTDKICYNSRGISDKNLKFFDLPISNIFNLFEINKKFNSDNNEIKDILYNCLFEKINKIEKNEECEKILDYETVEYIHKSLQYVDKEYVFENFGEEYKYLYYKYYSPLILYHFKKIDN